MENVVGFHLLSLGFLFVFFTFSAFFLYSFSSAAKKSFSADTRRRFLMINWFCCQTQEMCVREPCGQEVHWLFFPNTESPPSPLLIPYKLQETHTSKTKERNKIMKRQNEKQQKHQDIWNRAVRRLWGSPEFVLTFKAFQAWAKHKG